MLRNALIITAVVLAPCLVACGGSPSSEQEQEAVAETSEQGLTHQTIAASVNRAFEFFTGPKSEYTLEMRLASACALDSRQDG